MIVHDEWLLTAARLAIHLPTRTGVVADMHLGYAQARRRGGEAVPCRTLEATLAPLQVSLRDHGITDLVIAGDLFEAGADSTVTGELTSWLGRHAIVLRAVVPGNHDRGLASSGLPLAGAGFTLGRWHIVHGDGAVPEGPIVQGHEHPCLRWQGMSAPCYVISKTRLILPAFSPDASGVNMVAEPRWSSCTCAAIVGERVLDFSVIGAIASRLQGSKGRGGPRRRRGPPKRETRKRS